MLHPKIALFKPFNLLIEHNQHFYSLAATIFVINVPYILSILELILRGKTKMNYTHQTDNNLNEYQDQCAIFLLIGISCNV